MAHARPPITVMQLQNDPSVDRALLNPYLKLMTDSLPASRIRTKWFRWSRALFESFDILHVHWPEFHMRHRTRVGTLLKTAAFSLLLLRIRLAGKPIVRTVHNLNPHERGSRLETRILSWVDDMTSLWIVLNEKTPVPDDGQVALIPHGHYRQWYNMPDDVEQVDGRILTFGRVRAYKGIADLVTAFRALPLQPEVSLAIMGKPDLDGSESALNDSAGSDPRIRLDLRFIPDEVLAREICASEVVVLPYRDILNSGSALLALSLNRPVVLRDTPSTRLLADEFGREWVYLFTGELTSHVLCEAIEDLRLRPRANEVDMSHREWGILAEQLTAAYEGLV